LSEVEISFKVNVALDQCLRGFADGIAVKKKMRGSFASLRMTIFLADQKEAQFETPDINARRTLEVGRASREWPASGDKAARYGAPILGYIREVVALVRNAG
jgi:hypothetical protein